MNAMTGIMEDAPNKQRVPIQKDQERVLVIKDIKEMDLHVQV